MKRNLYLLSIGLVLCSCSEPTDVVTGHARIIMKNTPVVAPAPVAEVAAPVVVTAPELPKADYVVEKPTPVVSQNQPVTKEPAPAPTIIEEKPAPAPVAQNQPVTTEPAPAPTIIEEKPAPAPVAQNQPVTTEPSPAPAPVEVDKPVIQRKPVTEAVAAPAPVEKKPVATPVAQNQPATTEPAPATKPAAAASAATIVSQTQPGSATIITSTPAPIVTPVAAAVPAPVAAPAPKPVATQPQVVRPAVSQQQPRTTAPTSSGYRTPQTYQSKKRSFPIMPGQNRGLKNRYSY